MRAAALNLVGTMKGWIWGAGSYFFEPERLLHGRISTLLSELSRAIPNGELRLLGYWRLSLRRDVSVWVVPGATWVAVECAETGSVASYYAGWRAREELLCGTQVNVAAGGFGRVVR